MKKIMCALMVFALIALMAMPAMAQLDQDPRLNELRQQYVELGKRKLEIETQMIRLEGMFAERTRILADEDIAEIEAAVAAEEIEE